MVVEVNDEGESRAAGHKPFAVCSLPTQLRNLTHPPISVRGTSRKQMVVCAPHQLEIML